MSYVVYTNCEASISMTDQYNFTILEQGLSYELCSVH